MDKQFQVSDSVLLQFKIFDLGYKPPKEYSSKLGPTSTPVRIVRKIFPLEYKVALPAASKIHDVVSSIIHLKKYGNDTGDDYKLYEQYSSKNENPNSIFFVTRSSYEILISIYLILLRTNSSSKHAPSSVKKHPTTPNNQSTPI